MGQLTAQNPRSIQNMFGVISKKYDLANSILSFGIHHIWKNKLIRKSQIKPGNQILDCATGTGDLAFLFEKKLKGKGQVIGTDFCEPMLEVAREKAKRKKSSTQFQFADVMNLPFKDQQFDIASISFGIRNVQDTQKALSELGRVVKPGGRVLILEFGQPHVSWMNKVFGTYSNLILPKIGGWISGNPEAYRYLQVSSASFPCREQFIEIAKSTGKFQKFEYLSFQWGIAYLYILKR